MSAAQAPAEDSLERLRALLLARGGLVATLLADPAEVHGETGAEVGAGAGAAAGEAGARAGEGGVRAGEGESEAGPRPAALAAAGPRAAGKREEYELLLDAIYEGYLLHYGSPRVVRAPEADLGLLAGDQLYAVGLARLVELGDTHAVAELADTITLSALAQAAGEAELAQAVWEAGARAVGWGPTPEHERAKQLLREGAPEALAAMRTSAQGVAQVS